MIKLPHWILTDKFPAFYESESLSSIEMTARVYGAMQEMIDEYNKFVDSLNDEIEKFETDTSNDVEEFKMSCMQKFQEFIEVVDLKLKDQDKEINETIKYIKSNISSTISYIIEEMGENGELTEAILSGLNLANEKLDAMRVTFEKATTLEGARKTLYPSLSDARKTQIKKLSYNLYENAKNSFVYYGNILRNAFASNWGWLSSKDRWCINCELFVQWVWMGRDPRDFTQKTVTDYSANITPCQFSTGEVFDWGYYFEFAERSRIAGICERDADGNILNYIKYVKPNADSLEGSYSVSTRYNANCSNKANQFFKPFMTAGDMARELRMLGCEVPMSELQVGDIIFNTPPADVNSKKQAYLDHEYENISHVSLVYDIHPEKGICLLESTGTDGVSSGIYYRAQNSGTLVDRAQVHIILSNAVMVARHPAAFDKNYVSNVPEAVTDLKPAMEFENPRIETTEVY